MELTFVQMQKWAVWLFDMPFLQYPILNIYGQIINAAFCVYIQTISKVISFNIQYVNSGADQRKHQSSASLAFVWGIHRGPGNSPHTWPVTRKMFPLDDVIMIYTVL